MTNDASTASNAIATERDSSRTLEDVGALSVLTAMVEQKRRASAPAASEVEAVANAPGTSPADREPVDDAMADTARAPSNSGTLLTTR